MKIRTLPTNKYYKPGTIQDAEEGFAQRMIAKGFAEAVSEGEDERETTTHPSKVIQAINNAKSLKALKKLEPEEDAHEEIKVAYQQQLEFFNSNTKKS